VDKLAKTASHDMPLPFCTLDPGGVYLKMKDKLLCGGIKKDISEITKKIREGRWKKLSRQGHIMKKFKSKFKQIQMEIRKMAVENGNERVWSFFVLATLCWITPPPVRGKYSFCFLCSSQEEDKLKHFFECTALKHMHLKAEIGFQQHLRALKIDLPLLPNPIIWNENNFLSKTLTSSLCKKNRISTNCLKNLTRKAIRHLWPQVPSVEQFMEKVQHLVKFERDMKKIISGVVPSDFLTIMAGIFDLQVDGYSDLLCSDVLPRYFSDHQLHKFFGAEQDILSKNVS
jgi:hypothetical protein